MSISMTVDQIKIELDDLRTGMYVSRLDRPWIETPFPLQGYYVKKERDISELKKYCQYVYIDIRRGKSHVDPVLLQTIDNSVSRNKPRRALLQQVKSKKLESRKGEYKQTSTPKKEVKNALKMQELATLALSYIKQASINNAPIPLKETMKVVSIMVENIIKNPDAFLWLTKIKDKSSHLYGHTVRTTIWAVALGRHMGLSVEALNNLAMGIMLSEVGKTRLSDELLARDSCSLTYKETKKYQSHVSSALEMLKSSGEQNDQVLSIVAGMHERNNGSGYPRNLTGNSIPYLAKIAGIASYYDELTYPHNGKFALSPTDGIAHLYKMINQEFQKDLVEEFIQAVGIYPAGTLVELSTSETAMVLEQNPERRLRPKVILLLDADKKPYKRQKTLNLMKKEYTKDGIQLDIAYSLPMGAYGADPVSIYDRAFTSKWSFSIAS